MEVYGCLNNMRSYLLKCDNRYFVITKRSDQETYVLQHPLPVSVCGVPLEKVRGGPLFKEKPEGANVVLDEKWGAWLRHDYSVWQLVLSASELPNGAYFVGAWILNAAAVFVGFPPNARDDRAVLVEVSSETTKVALEQNRLLSKGVLPTELPTLMGTSPKEEWDGLWPKLMARGWRVSNEDRFHKTAMGTVAIDELELVAGEMPV